MRNGLRAFTLVALLFVLLCGPCAAWRFASIADSRGATSGVNTTTFSAIINRINTENVDLVIFQGDACYGSTSDSVLSSEMDTWLSIANTLNCPWYYTAGNHEIRTSTSETILRGKVDQPLNGPVGYEELVFSFDHENAHFVALNSNHYGQAHKVQRSWLTTDLAGTAQLWKFVMAHEPAYPAGPHIGSSLDVYPTERDDFWDIMAEAGVSMYFCGHEHLYQRSLHGSIYQVINGTCGAPIATGYAGTIAQYHYVVVEINGYTARCQAKDSAGTVLDTWYVILTPPAPIRISEIKNQPDGTIVSLIGRTVTAGTNQLTNTLYIEDENRSSGIRVYGSGFSAVPGNAITVAGILNTASGERIISSPSVTLVTPTYPVPEPLTLLTRSVGGGSLNDYTPGVTGGMGTNNAGLLVQVTGRVTHVDPVQKLFYVDDGCEANDGSVHLGVQVYCGVRPAANPITMPAEGVYVKVAGVCAQRTVSGKNIPMIRPREQTDIVIF